MLAVILVGAVLWLLTFFLLAVSDSTPWFTGTEILGALAPVLALAVPGLINSRRGNSLQFVAWAIALAPLLMTVGSFISFFIQRAVFGNVYTPFAANISPLITLVLWCIPAWLLHRGLSARARSTSTEGAE